jgi:hypothetical protein
LLILSLASCKIANECSGDKVASLSLLAAGIEDIAG